MDADRLGVAAVARLLGTAESTVYRLCASRRIRHYRVGVGRGRVVFDAADVRAYLDGCAVEVGEPAATRAPGLRHFPRRGAGR